MATAWARVVSACTERLGYKATAVALAVALWVAAHTEARRAAPTGPLARRLVDLVTGAR